ncbi:hypothetical protein [Thalassobacillus sp. CUG 92003]|uniref:hypothetical protein n=1 Tax=Thalassobacillus sp. CUG 92003 TaxID=2736641 RepID=UPI0015E6D905|nr:hypothetical protein [Thalassobacillus sp. CUG 92003]
MYAINLLKLFSRREDHLFKINEAERLKNFWNLTFILLALTILTFIWTSWMGLGTDGISADMTDLNRIEYELNKVWFLLGRAAYAILLFVFVLFISSFIFWLFNDVAYKKIIVLQMNVLLVMLLERVIWIPLMVYAGIDWYVSPFSFGVIAAYITDIEWVIYFFGALSLFQLWIIWYQAKSLRYLSSTKKQWVWIGVVFWHILLWAGTAALSYFDMSLLYLIR